MSMSISFQGTADGLPLGPRDFGVSVGKFENSTTFIISLPRKTKFHFGVWTLLHDNPNVRLTHLGDVATDGAEHVNTLLLDVYKGLREHSCPLFGAHGIYNVKPASFKWGYIVHTPPAGNASLKPIGRWVHAEKGYLVLYDKANKLDGVLSRARQAVSKAVEMPAYEGMSFEIKYGLIYITGWFFPEERTLLREVSTLQYDKTAKAWTVSTRYADSLRKQLDAIAHRRKSLKTTETNTIKPDIATYLQNPIPDTDHFTILPDGENLKIKTTYNQLLISDLKQAGARYDKNNKVWVIKIDKAERLRDSLIHWIQDA